MRHHSPNHPSVWSAIHLTLNEDEALDILVRAVLGDPIRRRTYLAALDRLQVSWSDESEWPPF